MVFLWPTRYILPTNWHCYNTTAE